MSSNDHQNETNKDLVRRGIQEITVNGNYGLLPDFYADDFVQHGGAGGPYEGREQFREHIEQLRSAFPDLSASVQGCICEDDLVAARTIYRGTHEGSFAGIESTGNSIEVARTILYRIEDERIAESWADPYMFDLLQQLGAIADVRAE